MTSRRRWSLRAKLIALVLAVAAVALAGVDIMLPLITRSSLMTDRSAMLTRVINSLPKHLDQYDLRQVINSNSANLLHGSIGFSYVPQDGGPILSLPPDSDDDDNPDVGRTPPTTEPQTVSDVDGGSARYLILAVPASSNTSVDGYLVVWSPLDDITATIHRLVLIELLVTAGLLVLLGVISGLIIRRELKPLETVATAADRIAGGDLQVRVADEDPTTEIGRLSSAFNGMLDGISGLLADRVKGEERLRQFIADASHELRTPVAAVRGYSDLYRAGALPDEAAVDRAMERMGSEALRMGALVDDLLTLIKADAPEEAPLGRVELADVLTEVVDDAAAIDATRTWRVGRMPDQVHVVGDRMRLHQLFANLLGNVRTHTPPGTAATISVFTNADGVAVVVSDDGPGVSEENLGKIFDRFFRADPARTRETGGTGLGLSIVAAIVRAHHGEVHAGHTPGGGLTITVILPLAAGTAAVPKSGPGAAPSAPSGPSALNGPTAPSASSVLAVEPVTGPIRVGTVAGAAGSPDETPASSDVHPGARVTASGSFERR